MIHTFTLRNTFQKINKLQSNPLIKFKDGRDEEIDLFAGGSLQISTNNPRNDWSHIHICCKVYRHDVDKTHGILPKYWHEKNNWWKH